MDAKTSKALSTWKYQRLTDDKNWRQPGSNIPRRKHGRAQLTDPRKPPRRSWRFKLPKKPKVRSFLSPKSLLRKLRDAYINMMVSFSKKRNFPELITGAGSFSLRQNIAMSNKDLQRLYSNYLKRAISQGRLILVDTENKDKFN